MACKARKTTVRRIIFTKKETTEANANVNVLTQAMEAAEFGECRGQIELTESSGQVVAKLGIQTSDDGVTWSTSPTDVGSSQTNNGTMGPDSWTTTSTATNDKLYARWVYQTWNNSGTNLEAAMGKFTLENRPA